MVKFKIHPEPYDKIYLERHNIEEITDDVNSGLDKMNCDVQRVRDLTIDVGAKLTIPKISNGMLYTHDFEIEDVDFGDFIMYPLNNCLGVVLPQELYFEDEDKFIFSSQVIDPCEYMFDLFRKKLNNNN
jgi:hypothetical protein